MRIIYQEQSVESVIGFYVKGFFHIKGKIRQPVAKHEYFLDAAKGVFVLKLFVEEPKQKKD